MAHTVLEMVRHVYLLGGACHILIPLRICWSGFHQHHFFYLLYGLGVMSEGRRGLQMLNPSGLSGGPLFSSPVSNNFTHFSIYFRVLFKTIY